MCEYTIVPRRAQPATYLLLSLGRSLRNRHYKGFQGKPRKNREEKNLKIQGFGGGGGGGAFGALARRKPRNLIDNHRYLRSSSFRLPDSLLLVYSIYRTSKMQSFPFERLLDHLERQNQKLRQQQQWNTTESKLHWKGMGLDTSIASHRRAIWMPCEQRLRPDLSWLNYDCHGQILMEIVLQLRLRVI